MGEKHKVFLAIPGPNVCWGTVVGVMVASKQHHVEAHNGGFGFSGVEDFNVLWMDAHNAYERGEITHFAMLHGDITPDASQNWLDILLEEMDARGATLISSVSPIKNRTGLTSSGIADPSDPWIPFRRWTMREIHERLPETFDAAAAGYPGRPLLHNTGMWACDLRKPCFHVPSRDGGLDLYFEFPTRAMRNASGEWEHQRESEDWRFSIDLWRRNIRDTYITRRTRLTHHGKYDFANHEPWGDLTDGDEGTAFKWRKELEQKPLYPLQMLQFELGSACNLGTIHGDCPNTHPERFATLDTSKPLDDATIIRTAVESYRHLGFSGLIGWHYYNEPLMQADRMFALMRLIKDQAPAARFILWTNGTLIPEDCHEFTRFEQVFVSEYDGNSRRGYDRLAAKGIAARLIENATFDSRLVTLAPADPSQPCLRPFVELVIDAYGNTHLCCYDWRGDGTMGNVHTAEWGAIAKQWRETLPRIAGKSMSGDAPSVCRGCGHRWDRYQVHDAPIVKRAIAVREAWQ